MDANPIQRAIAACKTQTALADRSGLSQQYISKLLSGKKSPSVEAAIAISRATDGAVRISDIVPGVVHAVAEELSRGRTEAYPASTCTEAPLAPASAPAPLAQSSTEDAA